jgi:hypothetical protein
VHRGRRGDEALFFGVAIERRDRAQPSVVPRARPSRSRRRPKDWISLRRAPDNKSWCSVHQVTY